MGVSVLATWVWWEYTQTGGIICLQRHWKNSAATSNKRRKQLKWIWWICIFCLLPFQMLLSSWGKGRLCRALHAEMLNEFFLMKSEGEMRLPLTPILSYWSVIVPRARQLLPPAPKWKGSGACSFKEDFDWSKIKQWQNIQTEINDKALDSLLPFGRTKKRLEIVLMAESC